MNKREATINFNIEKSNYENFAIKARSIISKLYESYKLHEQIIISTDIIDNSFQIKFWGIEYIIKTEIAYLENNGFISGELNTYVKNEDKDKLILTYSFDKLGNIQNDYIVSDFSENYFSDFFNKIIEYLNSNNINFQLI